jgi:hypothetical protein
MTDPELKVALRPALAQQYEADRVTFDNEARRNAQENAKVSIEEYEHFSKAKMIGNFRRAQIF